MKSNKRIRFYVLCNCLIIGMFILFIANQSLATTYCVANETELIDALNDAEGNGADDVIKIQQGTYYGNFVYASTESFGVTIEGGFTDFLCTVRNVDPENTILDGDENGVVLALSAPDVAANFVVDGLTLQNGNATDNGGGLYCRTAGTVSLTKNIISNNSANSSGGGVWLYGGSSGEFTLSNNNILNNSANNAGGISLYNLIGTAVTLTNNTISNNSAGQVGGVSIRCGKEVKVYLTGNIINYNNASGIMGGAFLQDGVFTLVNNIISNNNANGRAGGIHLDRGVHTLTNNIIGNNNTNGSGGGGVSLFQHESDSATLTNNTISNNNSNENGGGLWLLAYSDSADLNLYNNIIWNNAASSGGNDLWIENDRDMNFFPSEVNLFNNDFNHESPSGIYVQIPFPVDPSNLDNIDPAFVDIDNDDYHLKEDSLLINAGNNSAPEIPTTDKDGNPRIVGSAVDMGAYEFQDFVAPVATFMASPLAGVAPLSVSFTDESTGSIDSWYWDFGDGNDSTLQNPTHTYDFGGTYSVILTVTGDSVSDEETKTDYITAVSPDAPDLNCIVKEFHMLKFGEKIVIKLLVENSGNTKADPINVAFYLSDNGITQDEFLLEKIVNGGLKPGHNKIVRFAYLFPESISGKYIMAMVDSNDAVLELDETNNTVVIRVP